jgi:hypothetical protein
VNHNRKARTKGLPGLAGVRDSRPGGGGESSGARLPIIGPVPGTLSNPRGLRLASAFFAFAGVLELGLAVWEAQRPLSFLALWEASGRGLLHLLVAWGLWRRLPLCRSLAMVYCLAVLTTDAVVLALALARAPLRFPVSVIIKSVYEMPSCALLLPYLRSPEVSLLFRRAPFGP